jgi:hypothetical protein
MGFFGGGSTTVVSSSIYNLAGDVNKRPNYLKSVVEGAIVGDSSSSLGDAISSAYANGPGRALRSFYKWAAGSSGYNSTVGFTSGSLVTGNSLNTDTLAAQIQSILGAPDGYSISIESSALGYADISWWAEQWILENKPTQINTGWHCDYLNSQGVITWADGSQDTFTPAGFAQDSKFIFAAYTLDTGVDDGPVVSSVRTDLDSTTAFPSTDGWTFDSSTYTPVSLTQWTPVVQGIDTKTVVHKTTYLGVDPNNKNRTHSTKLVMTQVQNMTAPDGNPVIERYYTIDTYDMTNMTASGLQVFIYAQGSGNATLDAMFNTPSDMGSFFPYIPVRIDNQMVSDTYKPDVYAMAKKGYYKATGKRFDDLISKINANSSIGDIDYAYVVFGVSVNVAEITAKRYMWSFFEAIMNSQSFTHHAYKNFQAAWAVADASQTAYAAWEDGGGIGTAPSLVSYPALPTQSIEIKTSSNSNLNFDMIMSWNGVEQTIGAGMVDSSHAVGDIWWVINGADTFSQTIRTRLGDDTSSITDSFQVTHVTLYWQVDSDNWKALNIYGMVHRNLIYNGKSVDIAITDAINDTEESGFIIPLHEQLYQDTSLIDATQMATASMYCVFNCYQVVKKKWYQTGLFQIIVIIIIIIISIVSWGTGTGPSVALYGGIGEAIGLSGVAAVIAGIAISMIASMILSKILGLVGTAIFGQKVGAIFSAIATVVIMVIGSAYASGGDWTTALSQLTSPTTYLQLTAAVTNGISQYMGYEAQDYLKQTQDMLAQYNTQMKSVSDQYGDVIGNNLAYFDVTQLTDAPGTTTGLHTYEPADTFLNRTLMTGSDVAELNSSIIEQYASLTLDVSQNLAT